MKYLLDREPLHRILANIASVVERVKVNPILGNVKLQFLQSEMVLTTTDTELQMSARMDLPEGEMGSAFEITVGAQKLLEITSSVSDETLALEFENGRMVVHTDRSVFTLATMPAGTFPVLDMNQAESTLTIPKKLLKQLLSSVAFAISSKNHRATLRGMLLEAEGSTVNVVTTDGHRLARACYEQEESSQYSLIVPRKAVLEIMRLLGDDDDMLELSLNQHMISFNLLGQHNLTFASKLIIGTFPAYRSVIPTDNNCTFRADRVELGKVIKQATLINRDLGVSGSVHLQLESDQCTVSCTNPDGERAEIIIAAQYDGEPMPIAFNASYLQDVLSCCSNDEVALSLSDKNTSSVLIEEKSDSGMRVQHVIMPITL